MEEKNMPCQATIDKIEYWKQAVRRQNRIMAIGSTILIAAVTWALFKNPALNVLLGPALILFCIFSGMSLHSAKENLARSERTAACEDYSGIND